METNAQDNAYTMGKSVFQSLNDSQTLLKKSKLRTYLSVDNIVHNHRLSIQVFDVSNITI